MSTREKKTSVRRALSLSFAQKLVTLVFSTGAIMIMSRLLTPAEIGVFSIATGLVALVHMLRDFGITEFLIQEPILDPVSVRTVFTVNVIIAWCLGAGVFMASGVIGAFYAQPGVAQVLRVLSFMFFLMPFGTTTMVLLRRELEFGKLAKIGILQTVASSSTAVALAYEGFSYMSMAWSALVGMVVMIFACMFWGWQYRVNGLSLARWRRVLHFGSNRTIADIARQLGQQSAGLIIGKMLGMTDVGLFSRGYGVVNMYKTNILSGINDVAMPAFAREHREYAKAPELFRKALVYITSISWPFFACGTILAYPIIHIMFGQQWDAAVPLMRWLCGAAMIGTLMWPCNGFLVALGRVTTVTHVEVQYQFVRIGLTIAAAFYGLQAVAAAQVPVYIIAAVLFYRHMQVYNALAVHKLARALLPSAMVTLATCIVPLVVVLLPGFVQRHMVLAFAAAFAGGCAGWVLAVAFANHPLKQEFGRVASRVPGFQRLLRDQP